jgi:parallel beta-helix repeat protein
VDDGGSADILGNHITDIRDAPAPPNVSGCQNGVAILVGRQVEGTTGSARIIGNVVENYQKNGPTVDNDGSYAEIAHNRILGVGPTVTIAQNGIQVSRGATAEIRHNFVAENIYTPGPDASTGILFYGSGVVSTDHNTLTANDVGAYMSGYQFGEPLCGTSAGSVTGHNRVRASSSDGMILSGFSTSPCYTVTSVQVAHNKSDQNGGAGSGVYDAEGNTVQDNSVENNEGSGILLDNADNSTVGDNKVRNNGTADGDLTDGIRVTAASTDNTIEDNHLRDNVTYDCHDDGMRNTWVGNHGETSQPMGLCDKDDNDADFETSIAYGWDPAYPWYADFGDAVDFDWATAYATIDIESLLQLLPQIRIGGIRRATPSPNQ